jgi:phage recombination protein Bet
MSNTSLSTLNNASMTMWEDDKRLNEIRKLFAPKLTEMEFQFFVGLGKATNLNPFTREIWCVKYQDSAPAQVFIGRDGYRKAAQAHDEYDYHQCDAVYENDLFEVHHGEVRHSYKLVNRGELVGAYCVAKRHKSSRPIYVFAELKEYSTGKSLWNSQNGKPATMIKKVAESQCLRACFQDLLGGTYGVEEMEKARHEKTNLHLIHGETQTEKLKNILNDTVIDSETGEIVTSKKIYNSGRDDVLINEDQLSEISDLLSEKAFSEERINKALAYYKVDTLEQLTDSQARLFLLQLGKV